MIGSTVNNTVDVKGVTDSPEPVITVVTGAEMKTDVKVVTTTEVACFVIVSVTTSSPAASTVPVGGCFFVVDEGLFDFELELELELEESLFFFGKLRPKVMFVGKLMFSRHKTRKQIREEGISR